MEQIARDPRADFLAVYNRSIGRNGRAALLYWLENETDFFTAPASSKNHLAQPGGLAVHSLNVWRRLREIAVRDILKGGPGELWPEVEETVAILGLLHDVCKVGVYHRRIYSGPPWRANWTPWHRMGSGTRSRWVTGRKACF